MTYKEIIKSLQTKQFKPIYLLYGEESFFLDRLSEAFENHILDPSEKAFNESILYGKDIKEKKQVIDIVTRYPMMAERQVVIIKEAQECKDILYDLDAYCNQPTPSTILVFIYKNGKPDGKKKVIKSIKDHGLVYETPKIWDNQISQWVGEFAQEFSLPFNEKAKELIVEYVGSDLGRLYSEIEKLALNLPKGTTITLDHIEKYIGISKDYNVFELCTCLHEKNQERLYRMCQYFNANPKSVNIHSFVPAYFSAIVKFFAIQQAPLRSDDDIAKALGYPNAKIGFFKVKEFKSYAKNYSISDTLNNIKLLKEYDLKSKGVNNASISMEDLLTELLFRIAR